MFPPPSIEQIVQVVCERLRVDGGELCGYSRAPSIVKAREAVACLARGMTDLSFPEIARGVGRRNHSTVATAYYRCITRGPEWTKLLYSLHDSVLSEVGRAVVAAHGQRDAMKRLGDALAGMQPTARVAAARQALQQLRDCFAMPSGGGF